jgi:hypothetical protein
VTGQESEGGRVYRWRTGEQAENLAAVVAGLRKLADALTELSALFEVAPDSRSHGPLPVRQCPQWFRQEEHPGHEFKALDGSAVRCPGWPLPSIFDAAPSCETGDDRTCSLSCPLHG